MLALAALAAGAGLTFLKEISDTAIRRTSDIFSVVDSRLVVSIPTLSQRQKLGAERYG